jgi:hypothetical protein
MSNRNEEITLLKPNNPNKKKHKRQTKKIGVNIPNQIKDAMVKNEPISPTKKAKLNPIKI